VSDDTLVSNSPTASNPDIPVRATESADPSHTGKLIQHFRLDGGVGTAEAVVTLGQKPAALSIPIIAATGTSQDGLVQPEDVTTTGVYSPGAGQWAGWDGSVTQGGTWTFSPSNYSTATLANVAASASSVTLAAANSSRKELVIVNESAYALFIKFGSGASSTSYTHQLAGSPGGFPYSELILSQPLYTGIVTGVWQLASGNARVTECT